MQRYFLRLFLVLFINFLGTNLAFAEGYLYVNNNEVPNTISRFSVSASGGLTLLTAHPMATGGAGSPNVSSEGAAVVAVGPWLYVTNLGSGDISAFRINLDGSLTALPGQPFATGSAGIPSTLSIHPSQNFLVCGNSSPDDVSVLGINGDGTLTPVAGSPFPSSSPPYSSAFTPNGNFLFIGGNGGTTISVYSFNAITGSLTEVGGSPFASGGGAPVGYSVSPDGSKLFSALFGPNQIGVYDINPATGALTPIAGSPFASGTSGLPVASVLNGNGTRLFAVGRTNPNNIGVYDIALAGTPTPVAGSPFQSGGATANVLVIDNSQNLLFVANSNFQHISAFSIDTITGSLTAAAGSPFYTGTTGGFIGGMSFFLPPLAPTASAAPTMNEWGMITLIALLGIVSVYYLRRRRLSI